MTSILKLGARSQIETMRLAWAPPRFAFGFARLGRALFLISPFVFTFHQHFSDWVNTIDFKRLQRLAIDVKRVQPVVCASSLRERLPTHGFDLKIVWIVSALHNNYVLNVLNRAGGAVIQHTCSLPRDAVQTWRNHLHVNLLHDK